MSDDTVEKNPKVEPRFHQRSTYMGLMYAESKVKEQRAVVEAQKELLRKLEAERDEWERETREWMRRDNVYDAIVLIDPLPSPRAHNTVLHVHRNSSYDTITINVLKETK